MSWATVVRRAALWVAACLVCSVASAWAGPGAADSLRVVLWLHDDLERAVVERVRGQTSDLEVDLEVVRASGPLEDRATQSVRAWELAGERHADVVVWFDQKDAAVDRLTLHVAVPARERLLVRAVGDGAPRPEPGPGSATLEAAALVVRAALRAVAAGDSIGEKTRPEQRAPVPAPTPTAPSAPPRSPPPSLPAPGSGPSWYAALYWDASSDGVAPYGHQGPGLGFGPSFEPVELGVFANLGLPSDIDTDFGQLGLRRHALGLRAGLRLPFGRLVEWTPGLRVGLVAYRRSSDSLPDDVTATPDGQMLSLLLGPEARLGIGSSDGAFRLTFAAGLDLVPQVLRARFEVAGASEPAFETARLQPRLGVGAEMRLGE